ncbi:AlpA family transcriptional regulator [Thiomonas sp. Sup16B3]|uniref:helix-turn-helix transcriptional regulator n=2 Tax=Thiomonas TaxID=32012 RepID=UPI0012DEB120|nr:hypothetical protein [Thiomonas sp. Sup16B3]
MGGNFFVGASEVFNLFEGLSMQHQTAHTDPRALLRKSQIIGGAGQQPLLPIKNTTFYALIQAGKFPAPKKIGRSSFWPAAEVFAAIEKLTAEG